MPRNQQAIKIDVAWAESAAANRTTLPDSLRESGWGASYSEDGGDTVQRLRFNQLLCEVSAMFLEVNTQGCPEWDADIDYEQHAVVRGGTKFWKATDTTGPGTDSNEPATDPEAAGQTVWDELFPRTPDP